MHSLRKASIEHGMAIVSTTVTTTLYVTSEAFTIPKKQTFMEYTHRGLDSDMGMSLIPDTNLRFVPGKSLFTSTHLINVYTNLLNFTVRVRLSISHYFCCKIARFQEANLAD